MMNVILEAFNLTLHRTVALSRTLIRKRWFSNPLGSRNTYRLWCLLFVTLPVIREYLQFSADL